MYSITKDFDFSASHQLSGLPADHQCARLHGHNYILSISLSTDELDEIGFVRDYGELDLVKQWIEINVEHKHLNEVFDFNPTAENMAKFFFETFKAIYPEISVVTVKETPKTASTYIEVPSPASIIAEAKKAFDELHELLSQMKQPN